MEDLKKINRSLRKNMNKIISDKESVASRIEGSIEDVNKMLKMLKIIEDKLNEAEKSTLKSSGFLDQGLKERAEHVLFLLESFLPGDQIMKGKAKILEEESHEEKPKNVLEQLFKVLKEEEITLAKDQIIKEQQNEWILFKNKAFKDEEKEFNNQVLLEIATELFNKYYHNPILLEKIAALFSSKHTMKEWEAYYGKVLEILGDTSKNNPFHLMELINYEQLHSNIHICLCYCSLFPKDYLFNKTDLIHLWASHEKLSTAATNLEINGYAYFAELLKRGYFFEIIEDGTGDTLGYKMPYLVNEFLKEIAKPEFCLVDEPTMQVDASNISHLSLIVDSSWTTSSYSWISTAKKLRSLLFLPRKMYQDYVEVLDMNISFTVFQSLRALDMVALNCENIPSLLGELKDLRYLRLGSLVKLPESVPRLENLLTLDLRHSSVRELPLNFHIFRHLRHLYVGSTLVDMPPQLSKLESLNKLDEFVVGKNNELDALDCLKLAGKLTIRFDKEYVHHEVLKDKNLITDLSMVWSPLYGGQTTGDDAHHFLQPPPNLQSLAIRGWKRERFGNFPILKSLVSLCIEDCNSCKILPNLSGLLYLRSLQLWDLKALEYIEYGDDDNNEDAYDSYFPSLKYLMLANLHELKGWSSRKQEKEIHSTSLQLRIKSCPKMMSMPGIPGLESLEAHNIHESLLMEILSSTKIPYVRFPIQGQPGFLLQMPLPPIPKPMMNLEIISILELDDYTTSFIYITKSFTIKRCSSKLKELDFREDLYSLQQLVIHDCNGLQNISGVKNLSSLQVLEIKGCEKLKLGDDDDMKKLWEGLQSLHTLKLIGIPNLTSLGNGLMSLKKLEKLSLHSFYEFKSLPEWMGKLTQLQHLAIRNFPYLITLPKSIGDLSALQQLHIQCCPLLEQVPDSYARLNSLQQLKIQQCPKLFKRYHKMGDQDFPLKPHIDLILLE